MEVIIAKQIPRFSHVNLNGFHEKEENSYMKNLLIFRLLNLIVFIFIFAALLFFEPSL